VDEPWTAETIKKARERAEMCRVEAELASEPKKTELLETALAYERMIERANRLSSLACSWVKLDAPGRQPLT
jgi:hypothetical protein